VKGLSRALRCRFGYNLRRCIAGTVNLWTAPDLSDDAWATVQHVRDYTETSPERICALIEAVHFIVGNNVSGSIVECGVWRGGSMMAAALTLLKLNTLRHLYLFDTFEGMPEPRKEDVDFKGRRASTFFRRLQIDSDSSRWCRAGQEDVEQAMNSTGYDSRYIHLIKGKVEVTIPEHAPESIALLRLDTDWYESTRHELEHLFPRLSKRGVVIIDDYGHWKGARKAVDEYFRQNRTSILLSRIDYSARAAVKLD
jgi:O-methyltransferase